jgi:hypothetical protein
VQPRVAVRIGHQIHALESLEKLWFFDHNLVADCLTEQAGCLQLFFKILVNFLARKLLNFKVHHFLVNVGFIKPEFVEDFAELDDFLRRVILNVSTSAGVGATALNKASH